MSGGTLGPAAAELEPIDSPVKVKGIVRELYDDGSVLVDFPATGGASLGVQLVPKGPAPKVGDRYVADAIVSKAERDVLTVTIACVDLEGPQAVDLERARLEP